MNLFKYWKPKVRLVTGLTPEDFPKGTAYSDLRYYWYHWCHWSLEFWTGPKLGLVITFQNLVDGFTVGFTNGGIYDERGRFIISLFPLNFGIHYYTEKEMIEYGMIEEGDAA